MQQLTKIIQSDLTLKIKDVVFEGKHLMGSAINGAVQGLYTPLFMNSSYRQFDRRMDEMNRGGEDTISDEACIVTNIAQIFSMDMTHVLVGFYSFEKGFALEYFGALAATNAVDYLWNKYKSFKE